MQFEIYIKENDVYKKLLVVPPSGSDWKFFKNISLTVDKHLDAIREDLKKYYNFEEHHRMPSKIKVEDAEEQKKVEVLEEMRKINNKTKEDINILLMSEKFIICEKCGNRMIKTPINVRYEKFGSKFIIRDVQLHEYIKYVYMCEYCYNALSEDNYLEVSNNRQLRAELLNRGETFVPNDYGFWHYI